MINDADKEAACAMILDLHTDTDVTFLGGWVAFNEAFCIRRVRLNEFDRGKRTYLLGLWEDETTGGKFYLLYKPDGRPIQL